MRSRDLRHGVRLPDHEEVGDLTEVVLGFPFRARPTANEVPIQADWFED